MKGLFKRLKVVEEKLEALAQEQDIMFEEQPRYKITKNKGPIGFNDRSKK